ncbi:MAG: SAM-dependent methyltransferase [Stenotrophobium sp.]
MKASRSSTTAEQMALSRAIETRKPPAEQICCDPFAERFLSVKYKLLLLGRPLRDAGEKLIEAKFAGHHFYVIARTRYIDDFLQNQLASVPEQVVILGAGFDSRAYRFASVLRRAKVFEVDYPATSALKKLKIRNVLGDEPANVTYVPVDFNSDKLADSLGKNGYKDKRKTIFLWEGVTPYLTPQAVDETLQFIHSSGGQGSVVLFDYILSSVVDGTCSMTGAQNEFKKMNSTSEPLVFGIAEGESRSFLTGRGFCDVVDVGSEELKAKYFGNQNQDRYVKPWWRIVHAAVP